MASLIQRPSRIRSSVWDDNFANLFENFFRPVPWVEEASSQDLRPAIDISEREGAYLVHADLPGVKKEDIDINLENGVLTITAETRKEREEKSDDRIIRQERSYGKYVRSLRLGTQVDETKVKATFKDGVLELELPKAEAARPKKIAVDVT